MAKPSGHTQKHVMVLNAEDSKIIQRAAGNGRYRVPKGRVKAGRKIYLEYFEFNTKPPSRFATLRSDWKWSLYRFLSRRLDRAFKIVRRMPARSVAESAPSDGNAPIVVTRPAPATPCDLRFVIDPNLTWKPPVIPSPKHRPGKRGDPCPMAISNQPPGPGWEAIRKGRFAMQMRGAFSEPTNDYFDSLRGGHLDRAAAEAVSPQA